MNQLIKNIKKTIIVSIPFIPIAIVPLFSNSCNLRDNVINQKNNSWISDKKIDKSINNISQQYKIKNILLLNIQNLSIPSDEIYKSFIEYKETNIVL